MDHNLTLSSPAAPPSSSPGPDGPAGAAPGAAVSLQPEEEPESPGRPSRSSSAPESPSDPLAEGLSLLAGVAIALLTVVVPLATVISDHRLPSGDEATASGW